MLCWWLSELFSFNSKEFSHVYVDSQIPLLLHLQCNLTTERLSTEKTVFLLMLNYLWSMYCLVNCRYCQWFSLFGFFCKLEILWICFWVLLQLYFDKITELTVSRSSSILFKEALVSLATDSGLHPLVPYFAYFIADEVILTQWSCGSSNTATGFFG